MGILMRNMKSNRHGNAKVTSDEEEEEEDEYELENCLRDVNSTPLTDMNINDANPT